MRLMMANQVSLVVIKAKNPGRHPLALRMVTKKAQGEVENMTKTEIPSVTTTSLIKVRHTIMCMNGKMGLESIQEDHILRGHRNEK